MILQNFSQLAFLIYYFLLFEKKEKKEIKYNKLA